MHLFLENILVYNASSKDIYGIVHHMLFPEKSWDSENAQCTDTSILITKIVPLC